MAVIIACDLFCVVLFELFAERCQLRFDFSKLCLQRRDDAFQSGHAIVSGRRGRTGVSCHRLADEPVGGEAAVVYSTHSKNDDSKADGQVWIAKGSGLVLRMEADVDPQDVDHTHMSSHYDYANVHAPAGVK